MDSTDEGRSTRRPSLYAAIRLARLVQHFRERLKARVRSRAQRDALLRAEKGDLASFERYENAALVRGTQPLTHNGTVTRMRKPS